MVVVTVAGKLNDSTFQQCKMAAEHLMAVEPGFKANIISLLPTDYDLYVGEVLPAFPEITRHNGSVLCFTGDPAAGAAYIGAMKMFLGWCKNTYSYVDGTHKIFYERLAKKHMQRFMDSTGRDYCTLDISVGGTVEGTLLIELFSDVAPKTCANFCAFIKGHAAPGSSAAPQTYASCPVHRVVKDGWVQSGDVVDGTGTGSVSIFGRTFADETFAVKHDKPGIVAMASSGPHTNGCQFYVTQAPLAFLDGKKVGFGRVVDGLRLLKILNRAEVDTAERPVAAIKISAAAMYGHTAKKDAGAIGTSA